MANGVLDQVEEHALELLGVGARRGHASLHERPDDHLLLARLRAHRLDGLLHELVERHLLHRPLDVAGLQARELEEVFDQGRERGDVNGHLLEVAAPGIAIHEVVLDRVGQEPQRGERRAQIVGDGGDQVLSSRLRHVPLGLPIRELERHQVGGLRQLGDLVVGVGVDLHVPAALPHGAHGVPHRPDVHEHAPREHGQRVGGERTGEGQQERQGEGIVWREEHEQGHRAHTEADEHDRHSDREGELARQASGRGPPAGQQVRPGDRRRTRSEHEQGHQHPVPAAVDEGEGHAARTGREGQHQRSAHRVHG